MENRDDFLKMDDAALSACCELEFFKGTGNGGQKRNKTSSAVRVRLPGCGVAAEDCSERSQHRNRANALRKLRLALAYRFRNAPALLPERSECAVEHPGYPLWLARVLDLFAVENWEVKPVAARLGCSPSMLVKKLARDPELWKFTSDARRESGLPPLRKN